MGVFNEKIYCKINSQNDQRLKKVCILVSLTNLLLPHAPLRACRMYVFSADTSFGHCNKEYLFEEKSVIPATPVFPDGVS